ncbi:MAG: type II CAAX endopeptidase family protein [Anaerolineae bacterium]
MNESGKGEKAVATFFWLLFGLSVPFWLAGAYIDLKEFPLPFAAVMVFNPMIIALVLVYRESGSGAAKALLKRVMDYGRIRDKRWLAPMFLTMPAVMILSYIILALTGRTPPNPQVTLVNIPLLFVVFFITAIGEEIGWQGYTYGRLRTQRSALGASLIVGLAWAVWHVIPNFQAHHPLDWVVWQFLNTVALRVVMVWIYNNCGQSLFSTVAFHTMINVSNFAFPNSGSHYDPFLSFAILGIIALVVIWLWGGQTLAHYRRRVTPI